MSVFDPNGIHIQSAAARQLERSTVMLKIHKMPDVEKFISLVEGSCGDVMLHTPDGNRFSLKENQTAQRMFRVMRPGRDGISISFSNSEDAPAFLQYLIETTR